MTGTKGVSRRGALGLVAVGALAGCGLDTDSTIRSGLDVDAPVDDTVTRVPQGPRAGDGPRELILGFLRAGATSGAPLEKTKSFLTETCAGAWIPDSQTVLYGAQLPKVAAVKGAERTYRVSVGVVGRIDADGRYLDAPPNDGATFDFRLTRVEGEWRIDGVQDGFGRVLDANAAKAMYGKYSVHYPAIGWNALVADRRWIPKDQLATRITRAQLGRVPDYLENAVSTDATARLAVDSVPVRDGVAKVDLDHASVSTDATIRKQLAAQLVASLMLLPGVSEVAISLSGTRMEIPGLDDPLTSAEQLGFVERTQTHTPAVLARRGTKVARVSDRLTTITATDMKKAKTPFAPVDKDWHLLACSPDVKELAGVSGEGTELARWRDDGRVVSVPAFAADLTRPGYDYGGVLWVGGAGVGRESGHRLWAINAAVDPDEGSAAAPKHIEAAWLGDRLVKAAVVSPEGGRIAVISQRRPEDGSVLEVAGVARRANGLPTTTSPQAFRIGARLVEMSDAVWVGQATLAVIGRRDKERKMRPFLVDVGGEVRTLPERTGVSTVTSTAGEREVVVGTPGGRMWQLVGGGWQELKALSGVVVAAT